MQVELPTGQIMPRHYATADAFMLVQKGVSKLSLSGNTHILQAGATFHIPANEPHLLEIISDFQAYVVMASEARIEFNED